MRSNRMYSQLTGMRRLKRLLDRSEVERGNKAQNGTKVNLAGYQLNRKYRISYRFSVISH